MNTTFKNIYIKFILAFMFAVLTACSSPEDKAEKYYENGMKLLEKGQLVKANVEFSNAVQLNRKLTKAIWGQVLIAEKQNKLRVEYQLLNSVLRNDPEHLQALVKLGRLLLLAGQLDKALEKSDLTMKINNQDLSVLSLRAAIMLKLDDTSTAIKLAKQVLLKDPYYIEALMVLATERLANEDAQKAIEYIDQGLKKDEKNIALLLVKIQALEKLGKVDLAEGNLKRLIHFYPGIPAFNTMLAQFYFKHDRKNDAEKIYRTFIKDNPADVKAKIKLIQFLNVVKGADVALKQLQVFSRQEPGNVELKFALVQFYLSRKQTELANDLLENMISEKAGTETATKAKNIKAAILLSKGNIKAAEKIVNEILSVDKENNNALMLKANINIDRQKYDEAIADLRLVLRDAPDTSRALLLLARAYYLSGSPELADEQYFNAFKSSKFDPAYGVSYARYLLKRKQPKRAEKILQEMLSASKGGVPVLKLLAQTRLILGDWVGAQQVADVIKHSGDKSNLADQISNAVMVGKKDYDESIALLKNTYQSAPGNNQPIVSLVRTYLLAGKKQEAESFLNAVINSSPKNTTARVLRGQVYTSENKTEQAIHDYNEAIDIDPKNAAPYYNLAVIYIRSKNYDKAKEILNKGLSLAPKSFSLALTQAQLYEANGENEKAIKAYEKLLEARPDAEIVANNLASLITENRTDKASLNRAYNISQRFKDSEIPQFKDTFGWASYQVGKYSDADTLLKSAINQLPNIPEFHYHLGMNYLARDNKVMAREELEKALKLIDDEPFKKETEIRSILEKL